MGITAVTVVLIILAVIRLLLMNKENTTLYVSLHEAYSRLQEKNEELVCYTARLEQANEKMQQLQDKLTESNYELLQSRARWELLATTDPMTELSNHRAFQDRLREEISRARRYHHELVLLLIDVDRFKDYNDSFGHLAGDQALREIAKVLRGAVREGDLVARYGGEEFAVLLPLADAAEGRRIAEQIRTGTETHTFPHRSVTVSIGGAALRGGGEDITSVVNHADMALYTAKRDGRNRVVIHG